jgi:DNA-binding NarL/FixJ family response regulator
MNSTLTILVIGRHKQIMETVLRLLNNREGWSAIGALTDEEAQEKFIKTKFDLVLIGGGVEEKSERHLKLEFEKLNPQVKIIRHYGGGGGLLFNEIEQAFE